MKLRYISLLMQTAQIWANASYCERNKVGAVIAREGRIIATGYNGSLPGFDNCCEENGVTKESVMHAEQNALLFCAKHGLSTNGCDLFVTLSPCQTCAKLMIGAGIRSVYYSETYRCEAGIKLLEEAGIKVQRVC